MKSTAGQKRLQVELCDLIEKREPKDIMNALVNTLVSATHIHGFVPMETIKNVSEAFLAWEDIAAKVAAKKGLH